MLTSHSIAHAQGVIMSEVTRRADRKDAREKVDADEQRATGDSGP